MSLPYDQRRAAVRAYQRGLPTWEDARLKYNWSLHARPSQLPPDGDWDTWLILAGRGFGKTRTGAEWVRAQVGNGQAGRIALVARTLPEAQSIMIEGESGLLNVSPLWDKPTYEPSKTKAHLAQRRPRPCILKPRTRPAKRPSVRRRLVRRARILGVPKPDLGQPQLRPQTRTPATLSSHHDSQVHRACQNPLQRPRSPRHARLHIRQQGQPRPSILRRHNRPVRRNQHRPTGDIRRAHRRRRRRTLETGVDRESPALQLPSHRPNRRLHRPRHVHKAQQLRDRYRGSRSRHAPGARLRPRRRVRPSHPPGLGDALRPPIRQVRRHPHHRRGQRGRRPRQIHPQGRRPPHPALQGHQGPEPASASGPNPSPPSTSRDESTT